MARRHPKKKRAIHRTNPPKRNSQVPVVTGESGKSGTLMATSATTVPRMTANTVPSTPTRRLSNERWTTLRRKSPEKFGFRKPLMSAAAFRMPSRSNRKLALTRFMRKQKASVSATASHTPYRFNSCLRSKSLMTSLVHIIERFRCQFRRFRIQHKVPFSKTKHAIHLADNKVEPVRTKDQAHGPGSSFVENGFCDKFGRDGIKRCSRLVRQQHGRF